MTDMTPAPISVERCDHNWNLLPNRITFMIDGKAAFHILKNGCVELGDGITLDEASRVFWHHVGELGAQAGFWVDATKVAQPQREGG